MSDTSGTNDAPTTIVHGALTAMHMMAAADEYLAETEVDLIIRLIEQTTGESISIEAVLDMAEDLNKQASGGAIVWKSMFEPYRDLSLPAREAILKAAIMTAISDGEFHDKERRTLGDLADWLGLTPDEFLTLLERVRSEMS